MLVCWAPLGSRDHLVPVEVPVALKTHFVKFYFRGVDGFHVWTAPEDAELSLEDFGFFCFDDARGALVCVNTSFVQLAHTTWEPGAAPDRTDRPTSVRVALQGRSVMELGVSGPVDLRQQLDDGLDVLEWEDEDGETIQVRCDDILYLEYPSNFNIGAEKN